jgi:hypothetical protein
MDVLIRKMANQKQEEVDLNAIVAYFQKRQVKKPYFYYDVRVNPERHMTNLVSGMINLVIFVGINYY